MYWDGSLDEVRVSGVTRSTNWLWATWMTVASNAAFAGYGAVWGLPGEWTAYNDLNWDAGQIRSNITVYGVPGSGPLVDQATGITLTDPVALAIEGGTIGSFASGTNHLPVGTDAYGLFADKVDCGQSISWGTGTVTLTVSNLDPGRRLDVALYGSGGAEADTGRWTRVTLSDVGSFTNRSSAGATITTSALADDTTEIITGWNISGRVFRYDQVDPGSDGDFRISVAGPGTLNAFMIRAASASLSADSDGDGLPDAWEIKYFGHITNSAAADSDGDGQRNLFEYLAGTIPTNGSSVFRITTLSRADGSNALLWIGGTNGANAPYDVLSSTNLPEGVWTLRASHPRQEGTNTWWDLAPAAMQEFYRVAATN
jgi:hypothetical protein